VAIWSGVHRGKWKSDNDNDNDNDCDNENFKTGSESKPRYSALGFI
jgi:hypothetical protein